MVVLFFPNAAFVYEQTFQYIIGRIISLHEYLLRLFQLCIAVSLQVIRFYQQISLLALRKRVGAEHKVIGT